MWRLKQGIEFTELEEYGFWKDSPFNTYHKPIHNYYVEQFHKGEYLIVLSKSRAIVKVKLECILDFNENEIVGYKIQTNKVKKYCEDLIQAGIVEKV